MEADADAVFSDEETPLSITGRRPTIVHSGRAQHPSTCSPSTTLVRRLQTSVSLAGTLLTAQQAAVFKEVRVTVTGDWTVIFRCRLTAGRAATAYVWQVTFVPDSRPGYWRTHVRSRRYWYCLPVQTVTCCHDGWDGSKDMAQNVTIP